MRKDVWTENKEKRGPSRRNFILHFIIYFPSTLWSNILAMWTHFQQGGQWGEVNYRLLLSKCFTSAASLSDRNTARISDGCQLCLMNKNKERSIMNICLIEKNLTKGGDYFHVQTVQCCLTQYPFYVLNPNMSIHLVKHSRLKKIVTCRNQIHAILLE